MPGHDVYMSGRIIEARNDEGTHYCYPPGKHVGRLGKCIDEGLGTIWECECGKQYRCVERNGTSGSCSWDRTWVEIKVPRVKTPRSPWWRRLNAKE